MNTQHTSKIPTSEQENHGVHVCRKCGWHFPNAHPSAKLRRAHKKICGSIEGFRTVVDSGSAESSLHLSAADQGRVSDDDLKTPSPKIVKSTKTELGSSGGSIGGESNRSGYEVFLDADCNFSDTAGPSPEIEDHVADTKVSTDDPKDLTACLSRSTDTKDDVKSSEETVLGTSLDDNGSDDPGPALSHTATNHVIESDLHVFDPTSGDTNEGHYIKGDGNSSRHLNPVDGIPEILVDGLENHKALKDEVEDESSELMFELIPIEKGSDILDDKVNTDEKVSLDEVMPENDKTLKASSTNEGHYIKGDGNSSRHLNPVDGIPDILVDGLENHKALKDEDESSELMFELIPIEKGRDILDDSVNTDENVSLDEVVPENEKTLKASSIEEQASRDSIKVNTDTDLLVSLLKADEEVVAEASDTEKRENIASDHHAKVEIHATSMGGSHSEAQGVDADKMDDLVACSDTISTHLNEVSDPNLVGKDTSHFLESHSTSKDSYNEGSKENETNSTTTVIPQCEGSPAPTSTDLNNHSSGVEFVENTSENQVLEEPLVSLVESSVTVEDERARMLNESLQEHGDKSCSKQKLGVPAPDVLVDSLSQTESLEANWGSVSDATGFSTRSDALAIVDTEALPPTDSQTSAVPQKANNLNMPDGFKTLSVESSEAAPETQNLQSRKKNEEVINKVNNWTALKQLNPLKSFLGESNAETKQKTSSKPTENPIPTPQNDIKQVTTVNAILGPKPPDVQVMNAEASKEWNSPERYQTEIKRERRKAKGKPYWVPFVCCSSVN